MAQPETPSNVIDLSGDSEDDAALAIRIAEEEGLDVETARRLELRWKSESGAASTSSAPRDAISVSEADSSLQNSSKVFISGASGKIPVSNAGTVVGEPDDGNGASSKALLVQTPDKQADRNPFEKGLPSSTQIPSYPELSVDPLRFDVEKRPWPPSARAPYSFLAHALNSVSSTRSRILILNVLTNTLRSIIKHDHASLVHALYLLSNTLSPPYVSAELSLGPSIISRAIQHVSGLTPVALKRLYNKSGDAGDVAFEAKSNVRTLIPHPPLTVGGVYESLMKICCTKGDGATKTKQSLVEKLLVAAKGEETRFLVRTLVQHIRVGAVRTTTLTALARALVLTRPSTQASPPPIDSPCYAFPGLVAKAFFSDCNKKDKKSVNDPARESIVQKFTTAEAILKKVYVQHPNYNDIVDALLSNGLEHLPQRVHVRVGEDFDMTS